MNRLLIKCLAIILLWTVELIYTKTKVNFSDCIHFSVKKRKTSTYAKTYNYLILCKHKKYQIIIQKSSTSKRYTIKMSSIRSVEHLKHRASEASSIRSVEHQKRRASEASSIRSVEHQKRRASEASSIRSV